MINVIYAPFSEILSINETIIIRYSILREYSLHNIMQLYYFR